MYVKVNVIANVNAFIVNNKEGKITEWWLVNEEGFFFLILLVKRAKLIAHESIGLLFLIKIS